VDSRTYEVGNSTITLRFGDLTTSKAEVLVSSDDYLLSMGGGVSAALRRAGGPRVAADASKMVPAKVGDVIVSSAGDLAAKYLFHAVTIGTLRQRMEPAAVVRQASQRAMRLLTGMGCSSIAFPAIGAGVAGIPYETVAAEMASALVGALVESDKPLRIELYLLDRFQQMLPDDFFVFFEQFAARKLGLATQASDDSTSLQSPLGTTTEMNSEQAAQAQRRRLRPHCPTLSSSVRRAPTSSRTAMRFAAQSTSCSFVMSAWKTSSRRARPP